MDKHDNPNSYENVMRYLEELNDLIENGEFEVDEESDSDVTFKFEYAFESVTEKGSQYRKRVPGF